MMAIQAMIKQVRVMSEHKPTNEPLRLEPSAAGAAAGNDQYRIRSEVEKLYILRSMMRSNVMATCYFGHDDDFILTTIIDVDAEQGEMVLDYGAEEASNQRALKANKLSVVAFLDQVKIQFVCHGIEEVQYEGRNAFRTRIPETLLRIQKRAYYRIDTPTINPLKCVIPLPAGSIPGTAEVMLQDISCGGMAVVDPDARVNFDQGAIYRNCVIALPGVGTAKVNLRVNLVSEIPQRNGLKWQCARCEFADTPENMIAMVQRYITKLELDRKRKQ